MTTSPVHRPHDAAPPRARDEPSDRAPRRLDGDDALTPTLGLLFGEIAELKRVRSAQTGGRSLAEVGFRRAWGRLLAGADPEGVAAGEVAWAAAHVALGPVDAATLAGAGVALADLRAIYHRAAARWLGEPDAGTGAALDAVLDHVPRPSPPFVERLCALPGVARPAARHGDAEETMAEHLWTVAVVAGFIERARGRPPGGALLSALAPSGAAVELPPALAERIPASAGDAAVVADAVDRVLQQRHYANLAGFSLTDAVDPREIVPPGPLRGLQLAALSRLGLAF